MVGISEGAVKKCVPVSLQTLWGVILYIVYFGLLAPFERRTADVCCADGRLRVNTEEIEYDYDKKESFAGSQLLPDWWW